MESPVTRVLRPTLRSYQVAAIARLYENRARHPLLVAPTGSGKTVTGAALVERCNVPTLWLAHRQELITQAAAALQNLGLHVGMIKAGMTPDPAAPVQVAAVQTLTRRTKPPAGLVIIDECHHATAGSYRTILDAYPDSPRIGLTATPFRTDGTGLGDIFGTIIVAATVKELAALGLLHLPKVWCTKSPDLRGVKILAGDYQLAELAQRTNTPDLNADAVESWFRLARGCRTISFAVNVPHSLALVAEFQARGVVAEHIDGTTPPEERDNILARLRSGQTTLVSNCMVLTEGFDLPALECAHIARPTASLCLHLQMIGRIMRAAEGKGGALVLDCAGNHHVHGLVSRELHYSLDGREKVGHAEPLGLRRCGACSLMFEISLPQCPECGDPVPVANGRDDKVIGGTAELVAFEEGSFSYRRQIYHLLEAQRQAMGYQPGWTLWRYRERFGTEPCLLNGQLLDPTHATRMQQEAYFRELTQQALERGFRVGWASIRFKEVFGHWPTGFVTRARDAVTRERIGVWWQGQRT